MCISRIFLKHLVIIVALYSHKIYFYVKVHDVCNEIKMCDLKLFSKIWSHHYVHNVACVSTEERSDSEDSFDYEEEQEKIRRLHLRIQKDDYLRVTLYMIT